MGLDALSLHGVALNLVIEDILLLLAGGVVVFYIGRMFYRAYLGFQKRRSNPVEEAKERLRVAQLEAEAEKINREANKIEEGLYADVLNETGPRVVSDDEAVQALDEQMENIGKGKRHHG